MDQVKHPAPLPPQLSASPSPCRASRADHHVVDGKKVGRIPRGSRMAPRARLTQTAQPKRQDREPRRLHRHSPVDGFSRRATYAEHLPDETAITTIKVVSRLLVNAASEEKTRPTPIWPVRSAVLVMRPLASSEVNPADVKTVGPFKPGRQNGRSGHPAARRARRHCRSRLQP